MYNEYCEKVGGKSFRGEILPRANEFFENPSTIVQCNAWRAAAEVAIKFHDDLQQEVITRNKIIRAINADK